MQKFWKHTVTHTHALFIIMVGQNKHVHIQWSIGTDILTKQNYGYHSSLWEKLLALLLEK